MRQQGSEVSMHNCPCGKRLLVGALDREEGPGAPAGDPRRGGLELVCAIPIHRAGKYRDLFFIFLYSFIITLIWLINKSVGFQ